MRTRAEMLGAAALAAVVVTVSALAPTASRAATPAQGSAPAEVVTSSDSGRTKLDDALRAKVDAGATATVPVFVTASGDLGQVRALLGADRTARADGGALVIGRIGVQAVPKLASLKGVLSVGLIQMKRTGRPLGDPDPAIGRAPTRAQLDARRNALMRREVPFDEAPPLRGSHFRQLKRLGVMDAMTHDFAGAWRQGLAGEGTTVGVLDGGTDFGHPDLIGTWQTWSGATDSDVTDDGWNGWPKAFDPFGTLQLLVAPDQVADGLSWYTPTTPARCGAHARTCAVTFATRTGPSRNFAVPAGTATHAYRFPRRWSKSGTVRLGSHPDDYLLDLYHERPAFLVVDAHRPGVYDTVYVDLDDDHSFADEKPVTRRSPAAYRDMNGDGVTDLSGGLLYFISDGQTAIPGGVKVFDPARQAPAPGALLAWTGDYDPGIEGHGTLTASNVVGQAVVNGGTPRFTDLPRDGRVPGAVLGGAPHAKLAPYGDIYFGFDFSTQFGYLLSVVNGVDVTSNSYGSSKVDNDGFDAASQEADVIHDGSATTPLFATGNGAPGYGTTTSPAPSLGVKVGASTQFGTTGWDSLTRIRQAPDDDVSPWSDRGPGATGATGVDVVADGAYSSGDKTLNTALDGRTAWETWGGTSRSTPVAASAAALVYQAWRGAHGGSVPNASTVKRILKSSAQDLGYESFIQGSGALDAARAVAAARGDGPTVTPDEWRVGDYRGQDYQVFPHVIAPGQSDRQTFRLDGPGTWAISDRYMKPIDRQRFPLTTAPVASESPWSFNAPDYLVDLSGMVRSHPDADLMVIRANYPHSQLDVDGDYAFDQEWRVLTYRWTDVNHDGRLWSDTDHDGIVDHADLAGHANIDGNPLIDYRHSEIERGEYVRDTYHNAATNSFVNMVRDPLRRMGDGLFLGLQHKTHNAAIGRTDFTIEVDFYKNEDWPWLTHAATAAGSFQATLAVPPGTPYGMYDGGLVLSQGAERMVVPVSVAVAAAPAQEADGSITGTVRFGGADVAAAQDTLPYDNGSVFGANDWSWRAESGDWRFFFYDVGKAPPEGTRCLADTTWDDAAPYTDLDTLVFGRSANTYQLFDGSDPFGGPYILDTVGKSANTNADAGVWLFDTASGGAREVVTAAAQEGLHALVQHQVGWQGDKFDVPFTTTLGSAAITPTSVAQTTATDAGSFDVTLKSGVDLDGLRAEGFGLSQAQTSQVTPRPDNPDDPSTASVKRDLTIAHAARLTVDTRGASGDDDLYVVYDANHDGRFTNSEIVASGATGETAEHVELVRPPDGNYQIWVHGFAVSGSPTLTLDVVPVQGNDLTVSGVPTGRVPAGQPVTIHVAYARPLVSGQDYLGELLLGPPSAPAAFRVPIAIHRN